MFRFGTARDQIMPQGLAKSRINWVDYAKGICIVLVVLMHSTLGVEKAAGELSWLNGFIEWARPFRMPDFFLISGLFLASRVDKPWREYLDNKVLHFAYFYILWMTIQFLTKGYGIYSEFGAAGALRAYAVGFVEPFGTLWFIYMLAIFFVVVKLTRSVSPLLVFAAAALLEIAPIHTGFMVVDEFAARFVYFYAGYLLAAHVFNFADGVKARSFPVILSGLLIWGFANTYMVSNAYAALPGISLVLGFIGAAAVVASGVLLSKTRVAEALRYAGENSLVIYLAFFLFMAAARSVLLKLDILPDVGSIALLTTAAGVIGPLVLFRATRNTKLSLLFRRPLWARLETRAPRWHNPNYVAIKQPEAR
jgi:uncharacterized membrane protein YcfT